MRPHKSLAAASAAALGFIALVGGLVLGAPGSAQAFCTSTIDPTCPGNAANLPILIEAGVLSAPAAAGGVVEAATAVTVASGGVAGLGTFNTAIGIVGAATALTAGAAVSTGLLTTAGLPSGVKLHTDPSKSPGGTGGGYVTASTLDGTATATFLGMGYLSAGSRAVQCYKVTGVGYLSYLDAGWTSPNSASMPNDRLSIFPGSCSSFPSATDMIDNSGAPVDCYYADGPHGCSAATAASAGWHGVIRSTLTCTGPGGDIPETASQPVSVAAGGDLVVPTIQCPAGDLATAVVIEFAPTSSPDTWLPLTQGATSGAVKGLVTTYPNCFGPGVSPCTMTLQLLGGQGQWETCGDAAQYCPDWVAQAQAQPSMYRCQYGSYSLSLDHCSAFRVPGKTLPNYNSDTGTVKPITDPPPAVMPNPVQDPTTGQTVTMPVAGGQNDSSDCWPTGWGVFNPLAWVYDPIVCAAKALFIPKTDTVTELQTKIKTRFDASVPGQVSNAITGFIPPVIDAGGCSGFTISLAWMKQGAFSNADFPASFQLLQACPGDLLFPWAVFANLVITVGIIVVAFKTWPSLIGRIFNYGGISE